MEDPILCLWREAYLDLTTANIVVFFPQHHPGWQQQEQSLQDDAVRLPCFLYKKYIFFFFLFHFSPIGRGGRERKRERERAKDTLLLSNDLVNEILIGCSYLINTSTILILWSDLLPSSISSSLKGNQSVGHFNSYLAKCTSRDHELRTRIFHQIVNFEWCEALWMAQAHERGGAVEWRLVLWPWTHNISVDG